MSDGITITRWWWVRHAPVTVMNGRIYGQDDPPADCDDATLFATLAQLLPADAVWITSQLQRTHQTAAAIAAAGPLTLPQALVEPDFAEQHFGEWQGLTNEELRQRRNGELNRFWLAPAHEAPPGGESFLAVIDRVAAGMARLTEAHRGRDIVAVAHGGSIRAALAVALGIEAERALAFTIDNCSLTRLDHIAGPGADDEGQWRINAVNLHPRLPRLG